LTSALVLQFPGSPPITSNKLNGKNYSSWFAFDELWLLGQVSHDHLEDGSKIPSDQVK